MPDLPVWTIKPNWSSAIVERLEWLTDVLASTSGHEQRRGIRLTPRRSFEIVFNPIDQERSYLDRWLHTLQSNELLTPIWHDRAPLTVTANKGSNILRIENTYREFEVGKYGLLIRGAFDYEVVEITGQTKDRLTIDAPLAQTWHRDAVVYPLRSARLELANSLDAMSNRVGRFTAQFTLTGDNPYPLTYDADLRPENYAPVALYDGTPVMTIEPDRKSRLDLKFEARAAEFDPKIGQRTVVDQADRAFTTQSLNWLMRGRRDHHFFRQMLYSLNGQQKEFIVPTFNKDVELYTDAGVGTGSIDVQHAGHEYLGGPSKGRELVFFRPDTIVRLSEVTRSNDIRETISVERVLPKTMKRGTTGSFADFARLAQDAVEISHYTDTAGVSDCNVAVKTFARILPEVLPPLPHVGEIDYWFRADRETFDDPFGTGPTKDGGVLGYWGNQGKRDDAIQPSHALKPTWHASGGLNDMPYVKGAPGKNMGVLYGMLQRPFFQQTPNIYTAVMVTDQVTTAHGDSYVVGDPDHPWNRKATIRFKSNADEADGGLAGTKRVDWFKRLIRAPLDFAQPQITFVATQDETVFPYMVEGDFGYAGDSQNSYAGDFLYTTFMHNPTAPGGGAFVGRLYEFIYWTRLLTEAEMRVVAAYLESKYGLTGFSL